MADSVNRCVGCGDIIPMGKKVCEGCLRGRPGHGARRNGNKYQNRKVESADGVKFDSVREYRRWCELKMLEARGEISDLNRQVKYVLIPAAREPDTVGARGGIHKGKVIESECAYIADFVYKDKDGRIVVEDSKGMRTKEYIIKRKLMRWVHGIVISEV